VSDVFGAIYWAGSEDFLRRARADGAIGFDDDSISAKWRPVSRRKIPMRQLLRGEALKF